MPRTAKHVILLCAIACLWIQASELSAQARKKSVRQTAASANSEPDAKTTEATSSDLTPELIQKKLKRIEDSALIDAVTKKAVTDSYNEALDHLKTADEHAKQAATYRQSTVEAPREMQRVRAKLEAPRIDSEPMITADMGLAELQQALTDSESNYESLQKRLEELQAEADRRAERRQQIPDLQREAKRQLDELDDDVETTSAINSQDNNPMTTAETVRKLAHRKSLEHELRVYEEELRHYETTGDLIEAKRDHTVVMAELAERQMKIWRTAVNERRREEADRESKAALHAAKNAHPAIRQLAENNAALAAKRQDIVERIEIAQKEQDSLERQVEALEALERRIKERVKRVGLTETIGVLLRKQREVIPDVKEHRNYVDQRKSEMAKLNLELVELEDQRRELADIDECVERVTGAISEQPKGRRQPTSDEIRKILEDSRSYLDAQIKDVNAYEDMLHKLNVTEADLIDEAADFSWYSQELILWIKNADLPKTQDLRHLGASLQWIFSSKSWGSVVQKLQADLRTNPANYLGIFAIGLMLALSQRMWRKMLRDSGRLANDQNSAAIRSTGTALFATLMLSALWPSLLWMLGWRLSHLAGKAEFVVAIGRAFEGAAYFLMTVNITRHLCRSYGLGESHFDWPTGALSLIRQNMWWQAAVGLPLTVIVLLTESQADETIKVSLGRAAFVGLQALLLISAHSVWHSPEGFSHHLALARASGHANPWWLRLCRLAHLAAFAVPAALAGLAIVGYYYSAVQLAERVLGTIWLIGGLFVLHATLLRWLMSAYRELANRRAQEIQAEKMNSNSNANGGGNRGDSLPRIRLADINEQAHQLLGIVVCGAFLFASSLIWVEVLPALQLLDTVQLWPRMFTIVDPPAKPDPKQYYLTLAEFLSAILAVMATVAAARNIPGLVEITVLRRLRFDAGARYALNSVMQYAITACGLSLAFACVGIGWNNVQWLVAAMTVGLGFGLQEIFANFASGLLLLMERPIRVGDLISIGSITGKVSRIRIRATTITDGDMREAIIPNREFISGNVTNWTLTDSTARMTFTVKIPNGNNPDRVKQILLDVANKNPLVMRDPAPQAFLEEFAVDKLTFTLRIYMASCEHYNQLRHELNAAIRLAFIRSGIDKETRDDEPSVILHSPPQAA